MSGVGKAVGKIVGGITGSNAAADAAEDASGTQAAASQAAIDEQKRQFDKLVELLSPYVKTGTSSLTAQADLLGLSGAPQQQAAIAGIQNSPYFQAVSQQGENAILQNAAATGGLRGGNTQAALAQFRPQLLNQLIQQQYSNLGGLTQLGQASAAGQANAGLQSASNIGSLLQQQGAAIAGGQIASGSKQYQAFKDALSIGGSVAGFF